MEAVGRIAASRDRAERELADWDSGEHRDLQRKFPSTGLFGYTADGWFRNDEHHCKCALAVTPHDYDHDFAEWHGRKLLLSRCGSLRRDDALYMECNRASAGCQPEQQHRSAQRFADDFRFLQSELPTQGLEFPRTHGDVQHRHLGGRGSAGLT